MDPYPNSFEMFQISRSRVWVCCQALQRQSSLLQYKGARSDPAMPSFKADAFQNTDIAKLQSALRKRFLFWLTAWLLGSSSSRKISSKNIFDLLKGTTVPNDMWSVVTCIHVPSVTRWRSCTLTLQSLPASTTLIPGQQGDAVGIRESTADSQGCATSFNSSKSHVNPSQDTGSTNYILHLTLQEPLVSLWCYNIIPLVSY